nr:CPBP family intramembrane glutamic endopeptidase [uncultured Methanobrevibacter sp.]
MQLRNGDVLKSVLRIVILNIFFSYGMLYFSDFMLNISNQHNLFNSALTAGLLATIFVSPISEELIFRGVFLNRLQLVVPLTFAVLISSLLFAALHSFGGIFSAFIFAVCVAILYLKTDNICVPILAHFLNNLFAEIIVVLDSGRILFTNDSVMCLVSVLAICSFVLILRFIVKELNTISHNNL